MNSAALLQFEKRFCAALAEWLAMGQHEEPPDGFYCSRVKIGTALDYLQLTAAAAILREVPHASPATLEIGAGYGQLSMWLALQGRPCVAVEQQAARVAGMRYIAERVLNSQQQRRLKTHAGSYPLTTPDAYEYDSIVTGNVIGGWWPGWTAPRREKLRACLATPHRRLAVLDVERFGEHVPSVEAQRVFVSDVTSLGYSAQHEASSVWIFRPQEG